MATYTERYRRTLEDPLICKLAINAIMYSDESPLEEFYSCSLLKTQDDPENAFLEGTYQIIPPETIIRDRRDLLLRGQEVYLEIPRGHVVNDQVILPSTSGDEHHGIRIIPKPEILSSNDNGNDNNRNRQLAKSRPKSTGSFQAVMIRIIANDAEPTFSAEQLYNYLFSTTELSAKSQLEACSGGALTIKQDDNPDLRVMEVKIDTDVEGKTNKALMNMAEVAINQQYKDTLLNGKSIRDYTNALMFVVPPGTGSWAAFATVSGKSVCSACFYAFSKVPFSDFLLYSFS